MRKIIKASELKQLYLEKGIKWIAKQYEVSEPAVRAWLKKLGIFKPDRSKKIKIIKEEK